MEKSILRKKINDTNIELLLYNASVDTTFTLVNWDYYKEMFGATIHVAGDTFFGIRVAGNFTAKHLPWYLHGFIYLKLS